MKYIGENAIKKLISLIKGDLATKQDSIAATGVLERDTTGVINGVETVGATLVETQEATLVDVPNGLLKGDGTTISAAVAGTDYVNSSQAIRYDAAQSLTGSQKTQARKNIAAAPDGYGLGGIVARIPADANLNDYILTGFFGNGNTSDISTWINTPANWPANEAILEVYALRRYLIQRLSSVTTKVSAQRSQINDTWTEWEWVNPPMKVDEEYRTTERFAGKPVYKKIVSVPNIVANTPTEVTILDSSEAPTSTYVVDCVALATVDNKIHYATSPFDNGVFTLFCSGARYANGAIKAIITSNASLSSVAVYCAYTKG